MDTCFGFVNVFGYEVIPYEASVPAIDMSKIKVATNESITPTEALVHACHYFIEQADAFIKPIEGKKPKKNPMNQ